jgi:phage/plasmid-like protein (TIGR03299 family)
VQRRFVSQYVVVCQNTLGIALGERDGAEWRIHHTANAGLRLEQAGAAFRHLVRSQECFGELANHLAVTKVTGLQLIDALDRVMPVPEDDKKHDRIIQDREKVMELFEGGVGIVGDIRGTAWAAFNAFTEFADHHRSVRAGDGQDPRLARLESVWLGRAASLKRACLAAIIEQAGIHRAAA